jgi:hypothetical protein
VALFCDESRPCDYDDFPAATFCDGDGSVAGVANTCIPVPAGRCAAASDCDDGQVCDPGERVCRLCAEHDECGSLVCDRGAGLCIDEARIVYVDGESGEDRPGCGERDLPCGTLTEPGAGLERLGDGRDVIKLAPGTYVEAIDALDVTLRLVGPAELVLSQSRPVVAVSGGAEVILDEVTLALARGVGAHGVSCQGSTLHLERVIVRDNEAAGILAVDCDVSIAGSSIEDNVGIGLDVSSSSLNMARSRIAGNRLGGVSVLDSAFTIENNFILANGEDSGTLGGLRIDVSSASVVRRLHFNTIASNRASVAAVVCNASEAIAESNIVFSNLGAPLEIDGDCRWRSSDVEGGVPAPLSEGNNIDADPRFLDPAQGDYHLAPESPCRDAAVEVSGVTIDIDGDSRPQGPAPDMGADEIIEATGEDDS